VADVTSQVIDPCISRPENFFEAAFFVLEAALRKPKLVRAAEQVIARYINEKGELELRDKNGKLKPGLHRWQDLVRKTRIRRGGEN